MIFGSIIYDYVSGEWKNTCLCSNESNKNLSLITLGCFEIKDREQYNRTNCTSICNNFGLDNGCMVVYS